MEMNFKCENLQAELLDFELSELKNCLTKHITNCSFCQKDSEALDYLNTLSKLKSLPILKTSPDFVFKLEKKLEPLKPKKSTSWFNLFTIPALSFALMTVLFFLTSELNKLNEAPTFSYAIKTSQLVITQKMLKGDFLSPDTIDNKLKSLDYFKHKNFMSKKG